MWWYFLSQFLYRILHFIKMTVNGKSIDFNGDFVQIINGKSSPTSKTRHGINPANKQPLPPVPLATEQDVDSAVAAGKTAFKTWSRTPYEDRKNSILAFAGAIGAHVPEFSELLTREQGKPVCYGTWEDFIFHS
jgi:acyl-CoA reductase-like NAD-dependent aldehyde dehydrogenase